jgi:hypothetical protein
VSLLYDNLCSFIQSPSGDAFDDLAQQLFAYQYENNLPYRRLCDGIGITPANLSRWTDIPAVPAQAFRLFDLSCTPTASAAAVFHSSGTTASQSSKHWMSAEALSLYDVSLRTHFEQRFSNELPIVAVMPPPKSAPHSSLSHMLGSLQSVEFVNGDMESFAYDLRYLCLEVGEKIIVFGTAFALVELLQADSIRLPSGSQVIETGGFKGRTKELSREEFYRLLRNQLGVEDSACYSEYGMCEMASQFYSQGVGGSLTGPHWCRSIVIDPITREEAEQGTMGLLRHFDLANLNSVVAIQTQDRAIADPSGGFRMCGRASDAELRGCSLTAEELWSRG